MNFRSVSALRNGDVQIHDYPSPGPWPDTRLALGPDPIRAGGADDTAGHAWVAAYLMPNGPTATRRAGEVECTAITAIITAVITAVITARR